MDWFQYDRDFRHERVKLSDFITVDISLRWPDRPISKV